MNGKAARRKGYTYEHDVVKYLQSTGLDVQRIRPGYHDDVGDIMGLPNWVLDCKNHRTWKFGEWMDHIHSKDPEKFHALIVKRPQRSVHQGYVVMELSEFARLLRN